MSDRMRMLLTHEGPLKHVDHSHRARAAPAATGTCLSMKVGANMLIRGHLYILDPFLPESQVPLPPLRPAGMDPLQLPRMPPIPDDSAASAVVSARRATAARERQTYVPEQAPGNGIVKDISFAYEVSSRRECGMHPPIRICYRVGKRRLPHARLSSTLPTRCFLIL